MHRTLSRAGRAGLIAALGVTLAGCDFLTRLSQIGDQPTLSTTQDLPQQPEYQPISLPMPAPSAIERQPNSLWRPGSRAFFKDQRASQVGDILTVTVNIDDEADFFNQTKRERQNNSETANINSFLGYEDSLSDILPEAVDNENLVNLESTSKHQGRGEIDRDEQLETSIAAVVTQVLPNGNLVIYGRQEVRVNFDLREIVISGIVRPEDISATNTITEEKIAEARIAYGGRGQLIDIQQPRYGQQLYDVVFPF